MTDTQIQQAEQALEQFVTVFADDLSTLWHELDGKPEKQALVKSLYQRLVKLANHTDAVERALVEITRQRDEAVDEAKWQQAMKEKFRISSPPEYQKRLAQKIAFQNEMPVPDAMLVVQLLEGELATFEEPELAALLDFIKEFGETLAIEQGLREDKS